MNDVANFIIEKGVTIAMLAYFMWRDYKFMNKLDNTLNVIKAFVTRQLDNNEESEVVHNGD